MTLSFEVLTPAGAAFALGIAALLGACMGSFINCLAWRIVAGESVLRGRSHCPECHHELGFFELIPIVSWFALRGKCLHCKAKISPRYVMVEIVMAIVFVLVVVQNGITVSTLSIMALACILCGVTLVDYDTHTIPNGFILSGIIVWLASIWFTQVPVDSFAQGTLFANVFGYGFMAVLVDGVLAAFVVGGGMLVLSLVFDKITGKRSLGGGDIKLFFMVSLFLGLPIGLFNLFLACIFGLVFVFAGNAFFGSPKQVSEVGAQNASKTDSGAPIQEEPLQSKPFPFGPAIAVATMVSLLLGPTALTWYIGLLL